MDRVLGLLFEMSQGLCNAQDEGIASRERMISELGQVNDVLQKSSEILCHRDSVFHQTGTMQGHFHKKSVFKKKRGKK